jgi:hypothetical protein
MIANIMTIFYVLTVSNEIVNNGTLQKGTAVSRIDEEDGFQLYKYSNYLTSVNNADPDSSASDSIETTSFEEENMYLMTGKFSIIPDGSINVIIISNVHIPLGRDDIPVMKPTVQLLGKTMNLAQLTEAGYDLEIQVKPYLSKEQFNPFLINLTHPPNGRFKNALIKAKKNSTIHATGLLFLADKQPYCEILEFQFVAGKTETNNTISVPWKTKTDDSTASSSKSPIERRINLIRKNLETKTPTSPSATVSKKGRKRRESFATKISDISRSLLSQDEQVETRDSNEEINDNEEIEDDDENIEENGEKDDPPANNSNVRRSKRKKTK